MPGLTQYLRAIWSHHLLPGSEGLSTWLIWQASTLALSHPPSPSLNPPRAVQRVEEDHLPVMGVGRRRRVPREGRPSTSAEPRLHSLRLAHALGLGWIYQRRMQVTRETQCHSVCPSVSRHGPQAIGQGKPQPPAGHQVLFSEGGIFSFSPVLLSL